MLERSISRYCSESSVPSHMFPISELVPEMICNKLLSSLAAFETESFESDLRGPEGGLPSLFTGLCISNPSAGFPRNYRLAGGPIWHSKARISGVNPIRIIPESPYIYHPLL